MTTVKYWIPLNFLDFISIKVVMEYFKSWCDRIIFAQGSITKRMMIKKLPVTLCVQTGLDLKNLESLAHEYDLSRP